MIVVIDLDQTLLTIDSYPKWVFYLLRRSLATIDPRTFILVFSYTALRALCIYDHSTYKQKLMLLNSRDDLNQEFAKYLILFLRNSVLSYIENLKKKYPHVKFVISTAAPINYVMYLSQLLPFQTDKIIASRIESNLLLDNSKESKVRSFIKTYPDLKCDLFMTDHISDLPMMKFSDKVILVRPSQSTIDMVKNNGINFELILKDK